MRMPSEVLVVPRLPRKMRLGASSPVGEAERRSMTGRGSGELPIVK